MSQCEAYVSSVKLKNVSNGRLFSLNVFKWNPLKLDSL